MNRIIALFLLLSCGLVGYGQVSGVVSIDSEPVPYALVIAQPGNFSVVTNEQGEFIVDFPAGTYDVRVQSLGLEAEPQSIHVVEGIPIILSFDMTSKSTLLDPIVVSGTRTPKRKTDAPVIVGLISAKTLENSGSCNLAEGLVFQPGLRVETDCQTCNYTQLRMNGLAGGYSQILINGRPVFSPLLGLYGLEQIPAGMLERIEVVRGGGSSLYGSGAVGGTINVITKNPTSNSGEISSTYRSINGQASDLLYSANANLVSTSGKTGLSLFYSGRNRDFYDHNDDNFSELPKIDNNAFAFSFFHKPTTNQKLEINLSQLNEYRFGGEMTQKPAYQAEQAEERNHRVFMSSIDYQLNSKDSRKSLILYSGFQNTDRTHFTGILPDDPNDILDYYSNAPYGSSVAETFQFGSQGNWKTPLLHKTEVVWTLGYEYLNDRINDEIKAYDYLIDQTTVNHGAFAQGDFRLTPKLTVLAGLRMDAHNLLDKPVFNPRLSAMYKTNNMQVRLSRAEGFRAPQAFDSDLHISFAGGGVSRVTLSDNLTSEESVGWSASINYDKAKAKSISGFTVEGFQTRLENAFYLHPTGEDENGETFEKRNGSGATVRGITFEARSNINRKLQAEAGWTIQESLYDEAILYSDELDARNDFLRTPTSYGYLTLSLFSEEPLSASISGVFTGPMTVLHMAGAPEADSDSFVLTDPFSDITVRLNYRILRTKNRIDLYGGVRNLLNSYQLDFDTGKNRDSNYIYGPGAPRTFFIGFTYGIKP